MSITLREWLSEAPFSLAMSSGFFGFYAHAGVVAVLEAEGLRPRRLAGSSAGALVSGLWAAGVSAQQMREELLRLRRDDFWDPAPGAGLLRGRLFREKLDALLPVSEVERCPTPLAISTFDLQSRQTAIHSSGSLAQVIHASCALPVLFHPVRIDGRLHSDGGIADRPGLAGVPNGERVLYHHLSSKSPWRRAGDPALKIPARANTTTFVIDGLTRVHPFALERGARAYDEAVRATRTALESRLEGPVTRVCA